MAEAAPGEGPSEDKPRRAYGLLAYFLGSSVSREEEARLDAAKASKPAETEEEVEEDKYRDNKLRLLLNRKRGKDNKPREARDHVWDSEDDKRSERERTAANAVPAQFYPNRYEDTAPNIVERNLLDWDRHSKVLKGRDEGRVWAALQKPAAKQLISAMKSLGCPFNARRHICVEMGDDEELLSSVYDPVNNQVVLGQKVALHKENLVELSLVAELIHMFDHCRAETDFSDLRHLACSHVRSANLVNCAPAPPENSVQRLTGQGGAGRVLPSHYAHSHQRCVRVEALRELSLVRPEVPMTDLKAAIEAVFPKCYPDMEPFGRRLNPQPSSKQADLIFQQRRNYGYY